MSEIRLLLGEGRWHERLVTGLFVFEATLQARVIYKEIRYHPVADTVTQI